MDNHIPGQECPYCKHHLDAMTGVQDSGAKPQDGDFTVCFYCGETSRYTSTGKLAKLTDADLDVLDADPDLLSSLSEIELGIKQSSHYKQNNFNEESLTKTAI